jgi:hypothetical protein
MAREEVATCPDCRTVRYVRPWVVPAHDWTTQNRTTGEDRTVQIPEYRTVAGFCDGTAETPACDPLDLSDLVLEANETYRVREDGALVIVSHEWAWDYARSEMWCADCQTISDYCRAHA